MFRVTVLIVFGLSVASTVYGFPDGAPADTCVKSRFNEPNHGSARTQALHSLPYQVVASSQEYGPGAVIHCK